MHEWFTLQQDISPLDKQSALEEALRAAVFALEEIKTLHKYACWRNGRDPASSTTLRIAGDATARVWILTRGRR